MKSYFQFTRKQKIGVATLATISLVLVVLLNVNNHRALPDPSNVDVSSIDFTVFDADSNFSNDQYNDYDNSFDSKNRKNAQLVKFDPNEINIDEWESLGFSEKQANSIVTYRNNFGPFEKPEDVQKIYVVSDEKYQELKPFMIFQKKVIRDGWNDNDVNIDLNLRPININSATQEELESINGIGSVFANRAIKYRELLGGYTSENQFSAIYGITDDAIDALKNNVEIDVSGIKKIKINSDPKDKIRNHPYLDDWTIVTAIVSKRDKEKLNNLNFLVNEKLMTQEDLDSVLPYIDFE